MIIVSLKNIGVVALEIQRNSLEPFLSRLLVDLLLGSVLLGGGGSGRNDNRFSLFGERLGEKKKQVVK